MGELVVPPPEHSAGQKSLTALSRVKPGGGSRSLQPSDHLASHILLAARTEQAVPHTVPSTWLGGGVGALVDPPVPPLPFPSVKKSHGIGGGSVFWGSESG